MSKTQIEKHKLRHLLDQTSTMNHEMAKQQFKSFQTDTDNRINRVICKAERLHNLGNKLDSINNASKRAYKFAKVQLDPITSEKHVFAEMKAMLRADITQA